MPKLDVSISIPKTGSPVPNLCSIHAIDDRGKFGDSQYRGNCSGELIRDVLKYFAPNSCLDPMEGSGTCRDACDDLGIEYDGFDLREGIDALFSGNFTWCDNRFEFVWLHPPYWDMIVYNDNTQCLSQCRSLDRYLLNLSTVIKNCLTVLESKGHLAILIGDITRRGKCFQLPFELWRLATEQHGLRLAAPEIIRFQHGASSSKREYTHSFIPRIHDVLMVFQRQ